MVEIKSHAEKCKYLLSLIKQLREQGYEVNTTEEDWQPENIDVSIKECERVLNIEPHNIKEEKRQTAQTTESQSD